MTTNDTYPFYELSLRNGLGGLRAVVRHVRKSPDGWIYTVIVADCPSEDAGRAAYRLLCSS